jgi:hypothetical protein
VLNFHAADDDYYAEWVEELNEEGGWVALINTRQHVYEEMEDARLDHYLLFGEEYNDINWRTQKPPLVFHLIQALVTGQVKRLF